MRSIEPLDSSSGELVSHSVKANFRALGKRFGSDTPGVAAAITAADPAELASGLQSAGVAQLQVDGQMITIGPDDVVVTQTPVAGWAVATEGGETVALEVTITPELRREGLAREFIRLVQDGRKSDSLNVTDRIAVRWRTADADLAQALTEHQAMISAEVLAVDFRALPPVGTDDTGSGDLATEGPDSRQHDSPDLGLTFWIRPAAK